MRCSEADGFSRESNSDLSLLLLSLIESRIEIQECEDTCRNIGCNYSLWDQETEDVYHVL
jgi:hypothetical protein